MFSRGHNDGMIPLFLRFVKDRGLKIVFLHRLSLSQRLRVLSSLGCAKCHINISSTDFFFFKTGSTDFLKPGWEPVNLTLSSSTDFFKSRSTDFFSNPVQLTLQIPVNLTLLESSSTEFIRIQTN